MDKDKVKNDLLCALPLTVATAVLFVLSLAMICSSGQSKENQRQTMVNELVKSR